MSKKKTKNKGPKNNNRNYNNPHYYDYEDTQVTRDQIKQVAYTVFGSLYYNPKSDWYFIKFAIYLN